MKLKQQSRARIVTLDELEIEVLMELARRRCLPKRKLGIAKGFDDVRHGDVEGDFVGICGEYAVAKLYNVAFDTAIHYHGDNGVDLTVAGKTIQVKSTFYPRGRLLYNMEDDFITDYAILTLKTSEEPIVEIVGWTDKETFNKIHRVQNMGYGNRKVLDQDRLWPIQNLTLKRGKVNPYSQIKELKEKWANREE